MDQQASRYFTVKILVGMGLGILVGLVMQMLPPDSWLFNLVVNQVCFVLGQLFLNALKMLVVPLVFCSLVCGSASMGDFNKMGRVGFKSLSLYLMTTAIAITLALILANALGVGSGLHWVSSKALSIQSPPSVLEVIMNLIPSNPVAALGEGNMLQIVVFAILLGLAAIASGESGRKVVKGFVAFNDVMMRFIFMVIGLAPYGVFFLLVVQFSQLNWQAIVQLLGYFCCVLVVLLLQMTIVYSAFLVIFQRISPVVFFKKLSSLLVFAFSTSSSVVSIPITLEAVTKRLGVKNQIASFVIPLGATINMDGTAIMQGVATVFIAHLYHIDLSFLQYITVIVMATLASIGTAGVPGVGLITLIMVLEQVGLPTQGIAMIIGVDRLLDMARTAVNVSGDAMIACLVAGSEDLLDRDQLMRD